MNEILTFAVIGVGAGVMFLLMGVAMLAAWIAIVEGYTAWFKWRRRRRQLKAMRRQVAAYQAQFTRRRKVA